MSAPAAARVMAAASGGVPRTERPLIVKGQHGDDRDVRGDFTDGDNGSAAFLDVQEGLQTDQVRTGLDQCRGLFTEGTPHVVKRDLAQRLDKLAGRPDRSADVGPAAGLPAGNLDGAGIDLGQTPFQPVMGQLETVSAKGVGYDDIGAGLDVVAMNRGNHLRHRQVEFFRRLPRSQASLLEHGTHGAVQDQYL